MRHHHFRIHATLRVAISVSLTCILTVQVGFSNDSSADYHDRRERLVQQYALDWNQIAYRRLSPEYVASRNMVRAKMRKDGLNVPLMDVAQASSKWVELVNYWTIRNSNRITRIECTLQFVSLVSDVPSPSEYYYHDMFIIHEGLDNKKLLSINYGSDGREPKSVDYSEYSWLSEHRRSIPLPVDVFALIFLNGVSPFRALGTKLNDWRIERLTPEMWTLSLRIPEREVEVVLHLSRNHHDAVAKLEITKPREKCTYETRRYTLIGGTWFPAVVEFEFKSSAGYTKGTYTLLKAEENSLPIELPELPSELLVRWWRERKERDELENEISDDFIKCDDIITSTKWEDLSKILQK